MGEFERIVPDENDETVFRRIEITEEERNCLLEDDSGLSLNKTHETIEAFLPSKPAASQESSVEKGSQNNIPSFDLAQNILAGQRKTISGICAIRRYTDKR